MKKMMAYLFLVSTLIFIIDWGVMGIKIFDGDYNITFETYIDLICVIIMISCCLYRYYSRKCPYCGKTRVTNGAYCSYCGKKIDK